MSRLPPGGRLPPGHARLVLVNCFDEAGRRPSCPTTGAASSTSSAALVSRGHRRIAYLRWRRHRDDAATGGLPPGACRGRDPFDPASLRPCPEGEADLGSDVCAPRGACSPPLAADRALLRQRPDGDRVYGILRTRGLRCPRNLGRRLRQLPPHRDAVSAADHGGAALQAMGRRAAELLTSDDARRGRTRSRPVCWRDSVAPPA